LADDRSWREAAVQRRVIETKHRRLRGRESHKSHGFDLSPSHRSGPGMDPGRAHIDGLERGYHERPRSLWVAYDYSQATEGRMDLSKAPTGP
jgi:hypothetical protein